MKRPPILLALATAAVALSAAPPASAVELPCRTAKLIVPWGAGGGTDVIFRIFTEAVNKAGADPQLQVVNIGGQGGNKGAKEAVKAKPDGCTLFAIHQSAITSYFNGRVDFTWDAFDPVVLLTRTPVTNSSPNTSSTTAFQRNSIFSCASARSCMIFDARRASRL